MRLYTSNRLEVLADVLARTLETPLSSPLDPEIIVVQSNGMARWLSLQLARRHGICANFLFPFPNVFMSRISRGILSDPVHTAPFDPPCLTWRILKHLPALLGNRNTRASKATLKTTIPVSNGSSFQNGSQTFLTSTSFSART